MKYFLYILCLFVVCSCSMFRRSGQKKIDDFLNENPNLVKTDSTQGSIRYQKPEFNKDSTFFYKQIKPVFITGITSSVEYRFDSINNNTIIKLHEKPVDTTFHYTKVKYDFSNYEGKALEQIKQFKKLLYIVVGIGILFLLILVAVFIAVLKFFLKRVSKPL